MMMMMMIPVDQRAAALSFISSVARPSQNPINDATVKVCHRKQIEAFAWSLSESIDAP
jgi:hypothetical protein